LNQIEVLTSWHLQSSDPGDDDGTVLAFHRFQLLCLLMKLLGQIHCLIHTCPQNSQQEHLAKTVAPL